MPGSWKNEKISSGKRSDFHQLNTEVLKYLKADDPKGLKMFLSKDMLSENIDREVEHIGNRLTDNEYDLMDEYYLVHKYRDTDTVATSNGDINRYRVLYPYVTNEMYVAFLVPKKPVNKYMVTLVYGKFNYGWKIVKLDLGLYTINGKTAPQLFALAKDQFDKKEIVAALDNLSLAQLCWKPSSLIQYPDAIDAGKFYQKVNLAVEIKYHYPIVLRDVATGPMVLGVYNKYADDVDGSYPLIYYMTHFPLKSAAEVRKENLEVRKAVSKMMPGIEENNKYIYYSAFNVQPRGYNTVDHLDMVDTVK
jgi:hypothetical protein